MAVNTLTFNQLATILNDIQEQATGKTSIAPVSTGDFVSVATTTLQAGYDPVLNAITQVLGRTIFSIRPYNRRFAGIRMDAQKWGGITRKLSIADKDFEDYEGLQLVDGQSVDMYKVNKPNILQTNYYGANVYQKHITLFKDQLDTAFTGPQEFGEFVTMYMQNASDQFEQANENLARATIANFIGGKYAAVNGIVHLLTEYNTETGQTLTKADVMKPANYKPFMQWAYARMATYASLMSERSTNFQMNVTGKEINRHTPADRLKVYTYAPNRYGMEAMVLADVFHDNYLKNADVETVNFWQNIDTPDSIIVTPTYLNANGSLTTAAQAVTVSDIFAVMFDEEALGYTVMNEFSGPSPFNVAGKYSNIYWSWTSRYYNDFSEKGLIFILD